MVGYENQNHLDLFHGLLEPMPAMEVGPAWKLGLQPQQDSGAQVAIRVLKGLQ